MNMSLSSSSGLINTMHSAEIPLVLLIQRSTPEWLEKTLSLYTECIHPSSAFSIVAPFLFALSRCGLAIHLVLVCCSADVANLYLKWLLAGDRPYWVNEDVRQFPMTCEGGFGMPSGHVQMFAAATTFLLLRLGAQWWCYVLQAGMVLIGAFSRVYTGSHFPTQTAIAWIVGAGIALFGYRVFMNARIVTLLGAGAPKIRRTAILFGFALAHMFMVPIIFWSLRLFAWDPIASLALAKKACHSERGVVGLVWESTAKVLGNLVGVSVSAWSVPCFDTTERTALLHGAIAIACVLGYNLFYDLVSHALLLFRGDADSSTSVLIAFALGALQVIFAAHLSFVAPHVPGCSKPRILPF